MRQIKILFDFYINSSIHVALAVVSLALVTSLQFPVEVDFNLMIFIFFGTITGYNFVKYAGIAKLHHRSLARGLQKIQIFSLLCFILLLTFSFFMPEEILVWSSLFALLTLLYALPVFNKGRNLRSISGLKIFIIALVWAGVSVVLPLQNAGYPADLIFFLEVLQRFFLVLAWILPFEIRDLKHDLTRLGTIPQKVGVTKTKLFGVFLIAAAILIEFMQNTSFFGMTSIGVLGVLSGGFILGAREDQSYYFTSFWVEALPIFWLCLLILFSAV